MSKLQINYALFILQSSCIDISQFEGSVYTILDFFNLTKESNHV